MAMEVTQILLNAQSPDAAVRVHAEQTLKQFEEQNIAAFLASLCAELANPEKPDDSRRLAGLILKNQLDAKESSKKIFLTQRWITLDQAAKAQIKPALLATLTATSLDARRSAAQVIAKVAAIELPRNEWPDLISLLLSMAPVGQAQAPHIKESTLETMGFICEEIAGTSVLAQDQVNNLLTAIAQGMNQSEPSNDVRLAATKALHNALDFAQTNFENDMERNYIMQVICEATLCSDVRVRQAAFECLVAVATAYYSKLAPYMQDIFVITSKAAKEDVEPVALQAIELWSTICDEEIDIQEEEYSGDSTSTNYRFIKQALPALVPMLLEIMTKQEEGQDLDDTAWNLSMSGGTCLGLAARVVGDDIVDLVMPFVHENVVSPDWHRREAATYAFGSIMDGPSVEKLVPLVTSALSFMLNAIKDEKIEVRDTTAWTIARIFEFVHGSSLEQPVITAQTLPTVLAVLIERIKDAPNVAQRICGALLHLAQGYEHMEGGTSPLSPYMQNIMQALLETADREDAGEAMLRSSAYEALNEVVRCSADDSAALVVQLIPVVLQKLSSTFEMQVLSMDDKEKQSIVQAVLCGVLNVIINKLGAKASTRVGVLQYADAMMTAFLRVFSCRSATVHEEAMLAIGALANETGPDFEKYMTEFFRFLEMGLQNFDEYQVCLVSVGVVGDVCRALDMKILPFCDAIMTQLLKNLNSNELHKSVKPAIFSCLGDIALVIEDQFEKYLPYVVPMLQSASEVSAQQIASLDFEVLDYNIQLRISILEAYTGILMGFKGKKSEVLQSMAEHLVLFIENVYSDKNKDEVLTKAAVSVLGDLADVLGSQIMTLLVQHPFHKDFLDECLSSDEIPIKEAAETAVISIGRILGQ